MTGRLVKCTDRFVETVIDDEAVVMDLDSGNFFSLSGSALSIWELIDGRRDTAAIIAHLAAEYGADDAAIASDMASFIADLARLGFIRID